MRRLTLALLSCALLIGMVPRQSNAFHILGATINVDIVRKGRTLPATMVPFLQRGDLIEISFTKGVQFSRDPRWHLVVADMYRDYLQRAPQFLISDADLSREKLGYVWKVRYDGSGTPLIFLVPENGNQFGHGIPQARSAIADLANRALLLRTSTLSSDAEEKQTLLASIMGSISAMTPAQLSSGRERIAAATQAMFNNNLAASPCFGSDVAQSTQYACVADAITSGYENAPKVDVAAVVGSQLPVGIATYGMLIGAIYELLAKQRVYAHYVFIPGVMKPGADVTNVYVSRQPDYDPSARKPSTIVYFKIGSGARRTPTYGPAPLLPACTAGNTLALKMPFSGSPAYFRSHALIFKTASQTFSANASYDPIQGYKATLDPPEEAALRNGGSVQVASVWGFDRVTSPPVGVLTPYNARWQLEHPGSVQFVSGDDNATLTFADPNGEMGSCVQSVMIEDGLGNLVPLKKIVLEKGSVTVTADASKAGGAIAKAVITEDNGIPSAPLTFPIFPAMPKIASAIAYLPKGLLVVRGSGLKYIGEIALENTGITFSNGTPNADGSWTFTSSKSTTYESAWEHETMVVNVTLQPPDPRTEAAAADVYYSPV
jgi:hypothetical protein